jgi:hypothetical protein
MQQEAKRERLMRLVEQRTSEREMLAKLMCGETYYKPAVLHHQGTQWECAELCRRNADRPASRIYMRLPADAYEAKARHLMQYVAE